MVNRQCAINLYNNGSKNYREIYRLYYGDDNLQGYHIHHIDGNHKNNHPENLFKCSPEEHAEFHKAEGLSSWISLQNYAAVKGGKTVQAKIKAEGKLPKGWIEKTPEMEERRKINAKKACTTQEYKQKMSIRMRGIKKPPRTEEHDKNWRLAKSIGTWVFHDMTAISSWELGRLLDISSTSAYRWCKSNNERYITQKIINKNFHIFTQEDLGKTFKEKGFIFIKRSKK